MSNLFLAKLLKNESEVLIFTDGIKYVPIATYFPKIHSFTTLINELDPENLRIKLTEVLEDNTEYLNLIEDQHIFATGCTYNWSAEKLASLPENDCYKKVYLANRSMFFYKGNKNNLAANNKNVGLRGDSNFTIPEAEIVAIYNAKGKIVGYTIGNDMTAVDIEKENPLFQMQAKFYQGSVSLHPIMLLGEKLPTADVICKVYRNGSCISQTIYNSKAMNRSPIELVRQATLLGLNQAGGFLFLGCGVSHPKDKGLIPNDSIVIESNFLPFPLQNSCQNIVS